MSIVTTTTDNVRPLRWSDGNFSDQAWQRAQMDAEPGDTDTATEPPEYVPVICMDECDHPECIARLADLWADAINLVPPF